MLLVQLLGEPHNIVQRVASLLFHDINHILLEAFLRVIKEWLSCASHFFYVLIYARDKMRFVKLQNVALLQALGIDLRWFIIQKEVAIVDDTTWVEPLNYKSQPFEVDEDLNKTFFHHLNGVHLISRFENQLTCIILLRSYGIDKLIQN